MDHFAKSVDLTVVLGNLLENAVQAAGCCAGERYADLRIGKVPGVCMIQVRNSYDVLIDERNGKFWRYCCFRGCQFVVEPLVP